MRVMLLGADGQLGSTLRYLAPPTATVFPFDRTRLDLRDVTRIGPSVCDCQPDVVINAAAYTAVDKAESEAELAFAINAVAPRTLAESAAKVNARLIQISSDFVFAGDRPVPYMVDDDPAPLSAYGRSKLAGERAVIETLGTLATVVRTSWLYAPHGQNFVLTMLRLLRSRESLNIVYDQVGSPTWSRSLAGAIWALCDGTDVNGTLHWSDDGVASRYDFAVAIQEEALERGLLRRKVPINPIRTSEYPTPATRPPYSVLDNRRFVTALGFGPGHWRDNLRTMLDELATT